MKVIIDFERGGESSVSYGKGAETARRDVTTAPSDTHDECGDPEIHIIHK